MRSHISQSFVGKLDFDCKFRQKIMLWVKHADWCNFALIINLFLILSVFIEQRIYEITSQQFMKRRSPFCVPYVVIHILVTITWNHISNQFMREKGDLNALNVMLNFPKNLVWEHILNVCMKVCTLHLVSADERNHIKAQIL